VLGCQISGENRFPSFLNLLTSVHGNNLVYNTCWEDPRLDRVALEFGPEDNVLVITSAGCNALDYVLAGPKHVNAVDMNPRQNALLDLKKSAIRNLEYEDIFKMFGEGRLPGISSIYESKLRSELPEWSQQFWDKKIKWFDNPRKSFYYRGTSGAFARMVKIYNERVIRVKPLLEKLLSAETVEEQREIYDSELREKFWTGLIKFTMNRDTTMSMLGVPKAQRRQIEIWRVYMTGKYTPECCPEYLKPENVQRFKDGLIDNVSTHTDSVQGFLEKHDGQISKYILLDHMDWLSDHFFPLLESEWQAIIDRAAPNTRLIWRSGGLETDFIDKVEVTRDGQQQKITSMLTYNNQLSDELHEKDRVHTYGSFYIADLGA